MEWLKPILEKLNINAFFLAACIAAFIVWLNLKDTYLLLIWLCTAIYLFIVLVCHCYSNYRYNTQCEVSEKRRNEEAQARRNAEDYRIDIWFEAAPAHVRQTLVEFMSLRSMPGNPLIRFENRLNHEFLCLNESVFQIPTADILHPILLLQPIYNESSDTAYIIHPHLYDLVQRYINEH